MRRLIFVCTGNTCRSPLALAAWRALEKEGRTPPGIEADSAGLMAGDAEPPAKSSIAIARNWQQDLSAHRSKPLTNGIAQNTDWLVVMSTMHAHALREHFKVDDGKILLLGSFDTQGGNDEIPDPFGGSREAYETCAARIRRAVENLANSITIKTKS